MSVVGTALFGLLSACGSHPHTVPVGTALAQRGPQAYGVAGVDDARVGDTVMFGLPAFDNTGPDPVTITSIKVSRVPRSFKLVGYRTVTYEQTDGLLMVWDQRNSGVFPHLDRMSRPWHAGLRIPAHSHGDTYAMVLGRIIATPSELPRSLKDVEVTYRRNNVLYRQILRGEWDYEMHGEPPLH